MAGTNVENPEGFHFQDLRLTTNADETITAAVSLVNEDGESVEFLANGQDQLKLSSMLLINSSIKQFA